MLVVTKRATKFELETYYTLDDALKLIALTNMTADVAAARDEEAAREAGR
jgi:hypothetical protein